MLIKPGDKLLGNLDLNNNKIINLKEPTENSDCCTKKYCDDNSKISGDLDLKSNKLILSDNSKIYDSQKELIFDTSKFLFTNILSGNQNLINCFNKRITNISNPIENNDVVSKRYSDFRTNNLNMQNNRLIFSSQNNLSLSNLNPSIKSN